MFVIYLPTPLDFKNYLKFRKNNRNDIKGINKVSILGYYFYNLEQKRSHYDCQAECLIDQSFAQLIYLDYMMHVKKSYPIKKTLYKMIKQKIYSN